jgi:hypothetical protein
LRDRPSVKADIAVKAGDADSNTDETDETS